MRDGTRGSRDAGSGAAAGTAAARRNPTLAEAFGAQVRFVFRRRWALAALTTAVAAPMILVAMYGAAPTDDLTLSEVLGNLWSFPVLLSLVWPMAAAWRGDPPSGRGYHWTLPVDRWVHQLLRAAAGWLHLMAGLTAGVGVAWAWSAAARGGMAPGDPAVLLGLIPCATLLYLVGTVAAVATERPLIWLFVSWIAVAAIESLARTQGWTLVRRFVGEVFTTGALSLSAAAAGPQGVEAGLASELVAWRPWQALPLWLAVTAALVVLAARLHLERTGE